jgi:hypothetical protein
VQQAELCSTRAIMVGDLPRSVGGLGERIVQCRREGDASTTTAREEPFDGRR